MSSEDEIQAKKFKEATELKRKIALNTLEKKKIALKLELSKIQREINKLKGEIDD